MPSIDEPAPGATSPSPPGKLRDVHQGVRANRLRIALWAGVGGILGGFAGLFVDHPVLGAIAGFALIYAVVTLISEAAGAAAGTIYSPSGRSTPRPREYSREESLVARGMWPEAAEAWEAAAREHPDDPTPRLKLARLFRDELDRPRDAATWFRSVVRDDGAPPGRVHLALRELVELYATRLDTPGKAAPELARIAATRAGTPEGRWAEEELRRIKALMRDTGDTGRED